MSMYIDNRHNDNVLKVTLDIAGDLVMSQAVDEKVGLSRNIMICSAGQWYGIFHYDRGEENPIKLSFVYCLHDENENEYIFNRNSYAICKYGNIFYMKTGMSFDSLGKEYRQRPIDFILEYDNSGSNYYVTFRLIRCTANEMDRTVTHKTEESNHGTDIVGWDGQLYSNASTSDKTMKAILDPEGNLWLSSEVDKKIGLSEDLVNGETYWHGMLNYDAGEPNPIRIDFVYNTYKTNSSTTFEIHRYGNVFYMKTGKFFNSLSEYKRTKPIEFILEHYRNNDNYFYTYRLRCAEKEKTVMPQNGNLIGLYKDIQSKTYLSDKSLKVFLDYNGKLWMSPEVDENFGLSKDFCGMWYALFFYHESETNPILLNFSYASPRPSNCFEFIKYENTFYLNTSKFFKSLSMYKDGIKPMEFILENDRSSDEYYYTFRLVGVPEIPDGKDVTYRRNNIKKGKKSI